ncbi:MAG: hypothetical protein DRO11_09095, partial [Methanobacteriota archaeon]
EVFIVNFSINDADWKRLEAITYNVVWIDHHHTAINKKGIQRKLDGIRSTDGCGALLTWQYIYGDREVPYTLKLVDDWDRWIHKYGKLSRKFMLGMECENIAPSATLWQSLLSDNATTVKQTVVDIIKKGEIVDKFMEKRSEKLVDSWSFETELQGYSALAVNSSSFGSLLFGDKINKYDLCIAFMFDGSRYTVSVYSNKDYIDVGKICQSFGGGGHKGAAGFQCKELPFKKKNNENE